MKFTPVFRPDGGKKRICFRQIYLTVVNRPFYRSYGRGEISVFSAVLFNEVFMSEISVKNLTYCYEGAYDNVFEDLTFTIDTNWRTALIARNGRGKTTFLKLLSGGLPRDGVSGSIAATVRFDYFPSFPSDRSVLTEEAMRFAAPDAEQWRLMREFNLMGLDEGLLFRPFETLSGGERTKAMIAAAFACEDGFALIDEPTDSLDAEGRKLVREYLSAKNGFILVSHDRNFLDACVDHVLYFGKTGAEVCKGNYTSWERDRQDREAAESAARERLEKEADKLKAACERAASWAEETEKSKFGQRMGGLRPDRGYIGHKSAKMMKRAKVTEKRMEKALEEKEKLLKDFERKESLKIFPLSCKGRIVEARDLTAYYGDKRAAGPISFELGSGDRAAIMGINGSGKSTLLKLIAGADGSLRYTGMLNIKSGLKLSFVTQNIDSLIGRPEQLARSNGADLTLFMTILIKLGFTRAQLDKDLSELSRGQRKKTALALSLAQSAHLYVWDEPLNYIDVMSRLAIEELILSFKPTLLFVEHDAEFVKKIADKIICLQA